MTSAKNKFAINSTQFWILVVCVTWPTAIGYGGGIAARVAGRDMWLSVILALIVTILGAIMLVHLGRKYPGKTILEYTQETLGTIPGKLLGLTLTTYFLFAAQQSVVVYIHHVNDFMLAETPYLILNIIYIFLICFFVWHGPEVIARVGVIAFILGTIFNVLVVVAMIPEINVDRILPLLDRGPIPVGLASLKVASFIGQGLMVIAMLLPIVKDGKDTMKPAIIGFTIGGIFLLFYFVAELMVMGPHVTAQMRVACMDLVRSIQITKYLHRLESFMVSLWYWSMLTQAGVITYCFTLSFRQTIGIKERSKWLILATGILLLAMNYLLGYDRVYFLNFIENIWEYLSLPIQYLLPLFLFLVSIFIKPSKSK